MSSLLKIIFLIIKLLFIKKGLSLPLGNETQTFYDQRQTGKYNIHISLRDVAIIEVDKNDFSDDTINNADEYYYDEEDLTIRPISNWIATTIKTPQLFIVNTSKSETVDLQNIKHNKEVIKHQQLSNMVLESSFNSNLNSSSRLSSRNTTLKSDIEVSVANEPVSQVPSQPRLLYIPLQKKVKEGDLKQRVICRNYESRDAYGNCRSLNSRHFLKSLFDILKLMRLKN